MPRKEGFEMLAEVKEIVTRAGNMVLFATGDKEIREKSGHQDLVTKYDAAVQRLLEHDLLELLPGAGFLGEEELGSDVHADREYVFIVDPIDGTTNFVKGFPHCGVSVALARRGQIVLGVVYDPYLGEMFTAELGKGARLNGRSLHVSDASLEDGVSVFGTSPYYRQYADVTFRIARRLFDRNLDIRRMAAATLDLCYLAAGRVDCYFECLLSPWDYAAGGLIAAEAGAVVTNLAGGPLRFDRKCSLAAANPRCHRELLRIARECGVSDL